VYSVDGDDDDDDDDDENGGGGGGAWSLWLLGKAWAEQWGLATRARASLESSMTTHSLLKALPHDLRPADARCA
jgi:hypothetical protein